MVSVRFSPSDQVPCHLFGKSVRFFLRIGIGSSNVTLEQPVQRKAPMKRKSKTRKFIFRQVRSRPKPQRLGSTPRMYASWCASRIESSIGRQSNHLKMPQPPLGRTPANLPLLLVQSRLCRGRLIQAQWLQK